MAEELQVIEILAVVWSFIKGLLSGKPPPSLTPLPVPMDSASTTAKILDDPFTIAMRFIMNPSRDGNANDSAPGEKFQTSWGITQMTWNDAVQHNIVVKKPLADITPTDRDAIYRTNYWNRCGCDHIDPGAALMIFNTAVLSGAGHAVRAAQSIVGAVTDGAAGPQTWSLINKMDETAFIQLYHTANLAYLRSLKDAPVFINGWTNRENAATALALTLAQ